MKKNKTKTNKLHLEKLTVAKLQDSSLQIFKGGAVLAAVSNGGHGGLDPTYGNTTG